MNVKRLKEEKEWNCEECGKEKPKIRTSFSWCYVDLCESCFEKLKEYVDSINIKEEYKNDEIKKR